MSISVIKYCVYNYYDLLFSLLLSNMAANFMEKIKVLDLFSGIAGFSLGLERTGKFETVAFCEKEDFPKSVLSKHWPEVPIYEDVTTADFRHIEAVGLVTAGFPCQDASFAGPGAGIAGERTRLFWHVLRAVRMVGQPKLLLENVAALLNRGMEVVLGALAQIGYDAEWHCIPSSYVGGWSKRDRVWIYANPNDEHGQGSVQGPILNQSDLSRKPSRMAERWPGRSNLPTPRFAGKSNAVSKRVDRTEAIGNSVDPTIPNIWGEVIIENNN
jgi:DNA (cytosine-5)-methyltransferase 1